MLKDWVHSQFFPNNLFYVIPTEFQLCVNFRIPGFTSGPTKISNLRPFIKSCYLDMTICNTFTIYKLKSRLRDDIYGAPGM